MVCDFFLIICFLPITVYCAVNLNISQWVYPSIHPSIVIQCSYNICNKKWKSAAELRMELAMKVVYLHLTGIPSLLDRLDPADVRDTAVQERAGLADKHAQSQRGPVRLCRGRKRERREGQEVGDRGTGRI